MITIIILLILAGITINALTDNGLFGKTKEAKEKYSRAEAMEKLQMEVLASYDNNGDLNLGRLTDNITKNIEGATIEGNDFPITVTADGEKFIVKENGEVSYSGKGSTDSETPPADSVYTWKLLDYPLLTKSGMKNMGYTDQYGNTLEYKKDLTQGGCTAEDALPIAAWDDDTSTAVRTGTYYLKVAEEMINNTLVWNQWWTSGCTSIFTFCNENKEPIADLWGYDKWGSDKSGSKIIIENTKYVKYYSNGHYLYEISGQ